MPQLDLESLFCLGGGESRSKVACDTIELSGSDAGGQCNTADDAHRDRADARAESRRISWAWSMLTGAVLERDGSTKGSSNSKTAAAGTRKGTPRPRTPSIGKTTIVIGVLPAGKMVAQQRRSPVIGRGWQRPAAGARVFASEAVETEPMSPKVSCFGAVRSESRAAPSPAPRGEEEEEGRSACWASVTAALHHVCRSDNHREVEFGPSESKAAVAPESPPVTVLSPPRPVAVLGDVKRLASRRWPEGLAGEGRGPV